MFLRRAAFAPLIALLALGGGLAPVRAQQAVPSPSTGPQPLVVLVVDFNSVFETSKAGKMVREQLEQKSREYQKELAGQEEKLRHERDALQKQQASLSAEALGQKGREFQAKLNELDRDIAGKRQALEKSKADALSKINEALNKIVADIARTRKANLVFQRSELVLFDQGFDITDEALQKLDEQLPTLTVNFVAPTPAAAGSGQPTANAAPAPPAKKKK